MLRRSPFVPNQASVLRTPAAFVGISDPALSKLVERMRSIMRTASGVGLAAPQIGEPLRVFVAEHGDLRLAVANPSLTLDSEPTVWLSEACLSLPKQSFLVPRAESVTLAGFDLDAGEPFVRHFSGFEARILQHEVHHLEGTLIDVVGTSC